MPNDNPTKSKTEVHYRMAEVGSKRRGSNCTMFRTPYACTLVKGMISPAGDCDEFGPK